MSILFIRKKMHYLKVLLSIFVISGDMKVFLSPSNSVFCDSVTYSNVFTSLSGIMLSQYLLERKLPGNCLGVCLFVCLNVSYYLFVLLLNSVSVC